MTEKSNPIILSNHTIQEYSRLGSRYAMNTKGIDYVYMLEKIGTLKAEIGNEELKNFMDSNPLYKNWQNRFNDLFILLNQIKFFFDTLEKKEKTIDVKKANNPFFDKHLKLVRQINISDCYMVSGAYIFLLKQTNLKDQKIANEFFKAEERLYKKFGNWERPTKQIDRIDYQGGD